jgi:transglutaminase-like putative cysteine protease
MPIYQVTHLTRFRHSAPSSAAWQMLQLHPRNEPSQTCLDFQLQITPSAPDLDARTDYFGNTRHVFSLRQPHEELAITSLAVVRRESTPLPTESPDLPTVLSRTDALVQSGAGFELEQYRQPSPLVPFLPEARSLAEGLSPDQPVLEWLTALGERFAHTYTFDAKATDLTTPLSAVVTQRRGVCQDFTHLWLSCLRQLGLPAAYVSGYLLTQPPPGRPRLRGADAMHAWVAVHVPDLGWIDFDPTNNCFARDGHIVVARGRDYSDVSPTRGVYTGLRPPPAEVGVTVEPIDA